MSEYLGMRRFFMRKFKLSAWKLYVVRTLMYALVFCVGVALLAGVLLLFKNPLPFVAPLTLGLFLLLAFALGYVCRREENFWCSALPPITLFVVYLVMGLCIGKGNISPLALLYAVLCVGLFIFARLLPRKKRRRRDF